VKIVYLLRNPGIASRTPAGWESAVIAARPDGSYSEEDLREVVDADVLVVGLEPVGDAIFATAKRLKLVQRLGVGHCNIDLAAASRHGVPVCNLPDFNAATVAEHTIMLILALLRRVCDSTLLMKAGRWPVPSVVGGGIYDLQGKILGIIGLGAIGQAVARRAKAFDVKILYYDTVRQPAPEGLEYATLVELDELLRESDVVTIHVPLTPRTRGLLGRAELARMKRTAILVNTARGSVVDEAALAHALKRGEIAGAGLDVFSHEPLEPQNPLRRCPNVLLTPHTAGQTREAMERMAAMMLENMERVLRNQEPRYRVTPTPPDPLEDVSE
jgi:phosphoglycerate dehydrogenase-like enzyme